MTKLSRLNNAVLGLFVHPFSGSLTYGGATTAASKQAAESEVR
jgi:hypothetical protein